MQDTNLNQRLFTRVDDATFKAINDEMKKVGLTKVSDFLRFTIQHYLQTKTIVDALILAQELRSIKPDISRMGGNLNQLARSFNQIRYVNHDQLERTHKELQELFSKMIDYFERVDDGIREEFTPW